MTVELDALIKATLSLVGVLYIITWMYVIATLANWVGAVVAMFRLMRYQKALLEQLDKEKGK